MAENGQSARVKRRSYIRSFDRRRMIEIDPESFVNIRSARKLGLIAPVRRKPKDA